MNLCSFFAILRDSAFSVKPCVIYRLTEIRNGGAFNDSCGKTEQNSDERFGLGGVDSESLDLLYYNNHTIKTQPYVRRKSQYNLQYLRR